MFSFTATRRALAIAILATPLFASAAKADPKTERGWKANCASCHGADGKGDTEKGKKEAISDMSSPAWQKKFTDAQIKDAITKGVSETRAGVKKDMDPFKDKLKPEQIDALVGFVRSLAK
jgi:mono/diheme cytochrome c family protein